jgi:hypothetical protein
VEVPSGYTTNVSWLISFPDLKVAPSVISHDYHILLMQVVAVGVRNILPVNVWEAIMNFCFFFNAIGQKVLSEEALESLEKNVKGRRALTMHISYRRQRETSYIGAHLPIYLISQKKTLNRSLPMPCFMHQHAACPLAHIRARMCANGHIAYKIMKHGMEHKLLKIFEPLGLPCV